MNVPGALLWGFVATVVLTTLMSAARGVGLSRMSIPFMLGTMVTPDRDRAPFVGFLLHMVVGWMFAFVYVLGFESLGRATWWLGAGAGLVHGLAVLVAIMPLLPGLHPRMASERRGPEPTRALEPPGFLALNYGRRTPLVTLVAHVVYGAILGGFYGPTTRPSWSMPTMLEPLRLVTVHPLLTHFTVGALPLLVLAYGMAALRRSDRWTFVADATLVLTAAITVATAAFGLVSNAVLAWPGGLGTWRWLHLGFGVGSAVLLAAFAAARLVRRRRFPVTGGGALGVAVVVATLIGFTGWIGGEVLVYRAGMAVLAAGHGTLAPPIGRPDEPPRDLREAMERIRGSWAAVNVSANRMIVERPTPDRYAVVAEEARHIEALATWIAEGEPAHGHGPGAQAASRRTGVGAAMVPGAPNAADGSGDDEVQPAGDRGRAPPLEALARGLAASASEIARAADAHDLAGVVGAIGGTGSFCARCHLEHRWSPR